MFTNKIIETNSKEGQELLEYLKKKNNNSRELHPL